jgi:hypothetical protein
MNQSILLEEILQVLKEIRDMSDGVEQDPQYDVADKAIDKFESYQFEAIKKWEDSPAGKTNFGEKYKDLTLKKREDSSGKETRMKKVTQEDLKLCFKEYDGTISHEDFYKGLRAIDFYLPSIYNTFFAGIEFACQPVPPYKEEEKI